VRNERVIVFIETRALGRVAVVLVGAFCVGRITVPMLPAPVVPEGHHRIEPPRPVLRGHEVGTFHLGSTVVVLVAADASLVREPGPIQYGQSLFE
jgi:phosphatidylserine decarboxylase